MLILDVKGPQKITDGSTTFKSADLEIGQLLRDLIGRLDFTNYAIENLYMDVLHHTDDCPTPTLHAISAMGTKVRFYKLNREEGEIKPLALPEYSAKVNDTALTEDWGCDIVEVGAEDRLRAVVDEIMQACAAMA